MAQTCSNCGSELAFKQAYTRQSDGKDVSASWRCPQGCTGPGTIVWVKQQRQQPQRPQATQQPARQPQRPSANFDSRERSIAAQACAKAACEAAAGMAVGLGMSEAQALEFTVRLAKKLFNDFVLPASTGQQHPSVAGPTDEPPPIEDEDLRF